MACLASIPGPADRYPFNRRKGVGFCADAWRLSFEGFPASRKSGHRAASGCGDGGVRMPRVGPDPCGLFDNQVQAPRVKFRRASGVLVNRSCASAKQSGRKGRVPG